MLKKRIIPCLDIKDGRTVKGIHFEGLKDAGNPVALARQYAQAGADELVFLDITATLDKRNTLTKLVEEVAAVIDIPFTVGGGIRSVEDVAAVIEAGADKVSINSAAIHNPELVESIAARFGSQCVVVAIDARKETAGWKVYAHGGTRPTELLVPDWVKEVEQRGAGEILLSSIDADGARAGFDLPLMDQVCGISNLPLIASGGAGAMHHFADLFTQTQTSGALAASVFHFGSFTIETLKNYLQQFNIPIRCR